MTPHDNNTIILKREHVDEAKENKKKIKSNNNLLYSIVLYTKT
jgi:hypothetical protein